MQESHKIKCENKKEIQQNGYIEKEFSFSMTNDDEFESDVASSQTKNDLPSQECKTPENLVL